jgi:hypothetical protein
MTEPYDPAPTNMLQDHRYKTIWNSAKIKLEQAEGSSGPYERSEDVNSLDFKKMLKDPASQNKCLTALRARTRLSLTDCCACSGSGRVGGYACRVWNLCQKTRGGNLANDH